MAAIAPVPIPAGPPVPDSGLPEPTFDAQFEASLAWQRNELAPKANALAQNVYDNAQAAESAKGGAGQAAIAATEQADAAMGYRNAAGNYAGTATTQAGIATTRAGEAAASAVQASKLNLGHKSAPPAADNQGEALLVGATYYDTTLIRWRVWTGAAWGDGISAVAGVSSVNGHAGAVVLTADDLGAAPKASPTFTGLIDASGSLRGNSITMAALDVDCAMSNYFTKTIASNSTITFSNVPAAGIRYGMVVEITLAGGVISWPAGVIPPGGAWPQFATGKMHLFFFLTVNGGALWRANVLKDYGS